MGIAKKGTGQMPSEGPLRMEHISRGGRKNLNEQMRGLGMAKQKQSGIVGGLQQNLLDPSKSPKTKEESARRIITHHAMREAGAFTNAPITMASAVRSQTGLVDEGAARGRADVGMASHDPGRVGGGIQERLTTQVPEYHAERDAAGKPVPTGRTREMDIGGPSSAGLGHIGADWYPEHHAKLKGTSEQTGHTTAQVIAASAVMSPQNSPDQEYEAVHALAHAHADPKARVKISQQAVDASQDPSLQDWVGKEVHPSKLGASQLANLKDPEVRDYVETKGRVDLAAMAKGGVTGNVTKAINVLRGHTKPEEAIDPLSSPKVWSYHESIKNSAPGGAVHEEYAGRMDNALRQMPGQQRMDLFGLKNSTEGILSPHHPIANDTWMQAAQSGQRAEVVDTGRPGKARMQSPAKFGVGEAGAANEKQLRTGGVIPGASSAQLRHAWGQESVEKTAAVLSQRSGEIIPSVGAQAVAWTEIRRKAGGGKDAAYEGKAEAYGATQRPQTEISHRETRWSPETGKHEYTGGTSRMSIDTHPTPGKGQGSMFTQGGDGAELVNQKAKPNPAQQKKLAKQHAQGEQGSLFG